MARHTDRFRKNSICNIRKRIAAEKSEIKNGVCTKYINVNKKKESWGIFAKRGYVMKFGPYYSYDQCKEELDRLSKRNAFLEIRKLSW